MYLLYADESGTTHDSNQQYFVLAGFCVFEALIVEKFGLSILATQQKLNHA
ncbi:DUF3800 domain-containing protein [Nostoc sp.]|uniref:DUF3800 domain-containing protein n=1 Tax=Nostoc sp. TaxID=1180 RepID=UPI0039C9B598